MRRAPLATALACAALAGCGDDSKKSGPPVTVQAGVSVDVVADEYSFKPANIVVRRSGEPQALFLFRLKNGGTLPHDLRVRSGPDELGGTDPIRGGDSASARVPLGPGKYEIFCSIGDHEKLGMKGELKVE